jgi:hypothetical protein
VAATGAGGGVGFAPAASDTGPAAGAGRSSPEDFTTVERVDRLLPPAFTADETFFDFLLSASGVPFATLRETADKRNALAPFTVPDAKVTVTVNHTYRVVSTELTANVVGMVRGTDPVLSGTYVVFGCHLDHIGYAAGAEPKGVVNAPLDQDRIWNGADDDGSGVVGLMGMAKAFATGPKPRRSVLFVWHAGEEVDLLGSRYMVDHPVVPLDRIQAELNVDMIGRNRDNKASEANSLYVIGADRISTDLHNLLIQTNRTLSRPFRLDFEFNDPDDANSFYTRSDHYSYAARGIPVAFFFTGTHPDYHANTDTVDKILFPKLVRVAEFIYRLGFAVADSTGVLVRDHRGPRSGRGFSGLLPAPTR